MQRLKVINWIGVFIGTAGLTLLLLGLQFSNNLSPWHSAKVLSLLIVGSVSLVIFSVWEAKFVTFGIFPKDLFSHQNYPIILAMQFVEGMVVNTGVAYLVQIQALLFTSNAVMTQVRNILYRTSTVFRCIITSTVLYYTKEMK
jgi:drug/metabolite transporter (DMT)-like permease